MKVLISMDSALLRRIDRAAKQRGLSRSAYLAELAEDRLAGGRGPGATRVAKESLARLDRLFDRNPHAEATAAIRAERDARSAGS
jgi:hypothetical protein